MELNFIHLLLANFVTDYPKIPLGVLWNEKKSTCFEKVWFCKWKLKNAWNISEEQTKKNVIFFVRELDFLALVTLKRFYLELTVVLKDSG